MELRHFNYFWWDSEGRRIILRGTSHGIILFFRSIFFFKCRVKDEREVKRNVSYSAGQVVEEDDTR